MEIKTSAESVVIRTEVVCPNDTNPMNVLQGGRLLQWMDLAAAACAQIHSERFCVTAAINQAYFLSPAKTGNLVFIRAIITKVYSSSMEIYVQATAKDIDDDQSTIICTAFFTFVALDKNGSPVKVAQVKPVTEEEIQHFKQADLRKPKECNNVIT